MKVYIKQNRFLNSPKITSEEVQNLLADGFREVVVDDRYADCTFLDFDNWQTFSEQKYNARRSSQLQEKYEQRVVELIRQRYGVNDELAILRKKDTKVDDFDEYFAFVESAKNQAKNEIYGGDAR